VHSRSHGQAATAGHLGPVNGCLGEGMQLESGLSGQSSFSSNFGSMEHGGAALAGVSQAGVLGSGLLPLPVSSGALHFLLWGGEGGGHQPCLRKTVSKQKFSGRPVGTGGISTPWRDMASDPGVSIAYAYGIG